MIKTHSFHIPVMGIGFTLDTPLRVSQYGIDSVLSLGDDILLEKLRKFYCEKYDLFYDEISEKIEDFRAKRITSYLDLMNELTEKKFEDFKTVLSEKSADLKEYFNMLPDYSSIKQEFNRLASDYFDINKISNWLSDNLSMGSIDVNIMTKLDKENYIKDEKLPIEFNDAHAAIRGYANSNVESSVILSAGMNPRLYSYIENFDGFFPNENGKIKKKLILKVSDYRSALIQGKFLAKKGLWVSEYRIESGLNCGGHAFATEGYLLGPILEEFKEHKAELIESIHEILIQALEAKNRVLPNQTLELNVTAQGGVGTNMEHDFLLNHYEVDSVGWGTPFLLVPEATTVDEKTIDQLVKAKEEDLYLSGISPLGIPFNNLRGNTKDLTKLALIEKGRPGSSCPKKYLVSNKEFTEKTICTASRQYQNLKLKELDESNLSTEEHDKQFNLITDKSCICVGLGTTVLLNNNLSTKVEGDGVSICPGPNMAYFDKVMSLKEITGHIYGETNMMTRTDRPNMFVKELNIYIKYFKDQISESELPLNRKQSKYLSSFGKNLTDGIDYYKQLFSNFKNQFDNSKSTIQQDLAISNQALDMLIGEVEQLPLK